MKRLLILCILLGLLCAACADPVEPSSSVSGAESSEEASSSPETPEEELWQRQEYEQPEPLTRFTLDDRDAEYTAVETTVTPLFTLDEQVRDSSTMYYMVGENIALYKQQEFVTVLDLQGNQLAQHPCRGVSAYFSGEFFAIEEYGTHSMVIYDSNGKEHATVPIGSIAGTVQRVDVMPDGGLAILQADSIEGEYGMYEVRLDSPDTVPTPLEIELPQDMVFNFGIDMTAGSIIGLEAAKADESRYKIYYDFAEGKIVDTVPFALEDSSEDEYRYPAVYTTKSGLVYETEDASSLQLGFDIRLYGDDLYFLYQGVFRVYNPVSSQMRSGEFPLYNTILLGMDSPDSAVVCHFDKEEYKISRVTLGTKIVQPQPGLDLSPQMLETIAGQQLAHRSFPHNTYGLISAIAAQYVDWFAYEGYLMSDEIDELEDILIWATRRNQYGYINGINKRWEEYADEYGYRVPREIMQQWIEELFNLGDITLDLTSSNSYNAGTDTLDLMYGGGIGEEDTVYITKAEYSKGMFDLAVRVIPYRLDEKPPLTLQMKVSYDEDSGTYRYESVELVE